MSSILRDFFIINSTHLFGFFYLFFFRRFSSTVEVLQQMFGTANGAGRKTNWFHVGEKISFSWRPFPDVKGQLCAAQADAPPICLHPNAATNIHSRVVKVSAE